MHAPAAHPRPPRDCESRAQSRTMPLPHKCSGFLQTEEAALSLSPACILPSSRPVWRHGARKGREEQSLLPPSPQSELSRERSTGWGAACEGAGLGWLLRGPHWPWAPILPQRNHPPPGARPSPGATFQPSALAFPTTEEMGTWAGAGRRNKAHAGASRCLLTHPRTLPFLGEHDSLETCDMTSWGSDSKLQMGSGCQQRWAQQTRGPVSD